MNSRVSYHPMRAHTQRDSADASASGGCGGSGFGSAARGSHLGEPALFFKHTESSNHRLYSFSIPTFVRVYFFIDFL